MKFDFSSYYSFPDEVVMNLDMLSVGMENKVSGKF
jgi:hypothetical protein